MAARRITAEPSVDDLDEVLHAERVDVGRRRRTYVEPWSRLPDGVMVADDEGRAYLVHAGRLLPWSPAGYGPAQSPGTTAPLRVLTPRSIVAAIHHGYPVRQHASTGVAADISGRRGALPM
jgi:hypothetical protein